MVTRAERADAIAPVYTAIDRLVATGLTPREAAQAITEAVWDRAAELDPPGRLAADRSPGFEQPIRRRGAAPDMVERAGLRESRTGDTRPNPLFGA